jgi:hypothetical protein
VLILLLPAAAQMLLRPCSKQAQSSRMAMPSAAGPDASSEYTMIMTSVDSTASASAASSGYEGLQVREIY